MENETLINSSNASESVVTDVNPETQDSGDPTSKTNVEETDLFDDYQEVDTKVTDNQIERGKPDKGKSKEYAEKRRKREAEERERGYQEGVKEALGGKNPYTGEEITDDYDFELYKEMREAKKAGFDPVTELWKYQAQQRRKEAEEKAKLEADEKAEKEYAINDAKEFSKKYKDIDVNKLLADERFKIFSEGKLFSIPLTEIYESFINYESMVDTKAREIAEKKYARMMSTTGSLKSTQTMDIPEKSIWEMSKEEFKAYKAKHNLR